LDRRFRTRIVFVGEPSALIALTVADALGMVPLSRTPFLLLQEFLSGFWLGVLFLVSGRNLTIPFVAHGVSNTLAFILVYFNRYPGRW
jgi:hypothetical protein